MSLQQSSLIDCLRPAATLPAGTSILAFRRLALLLLAIPASGCGASSPELLSPKGTVTFDGRTVSYGTVEFLPDAEKGHQGSTVSADIIDGAYDTTGGEGKRLSKGPHVARVTIFPDKPLPRPEQSSSTAVPIALGYPVKINVETPELDIAVPASARGFDMFNSRSGESRATAP